ncbi:hypothetical protein A8709_21735 [Paenibacillus pectinilyticus]|uniref:Uncharacterized protein n=1 Tax=Paenibacillus pectinilyticus TaxID=512399 RepID=A0A1C0ZXU3_9BACL|nr:hypothetical protein [Paenibacillus pectinilyticus]OCT12946.1 hypothetical protein A8709_21735 [Paenibacillus pectinilyticus]
MNFTMNNIKDVTEKFDKFGITYSLGGSGLLLSLGLTNSINDWDVMVEAPKDHVLKALTPFNIEEKPCGDYPFGTAYKLLVHNQRPQVEILGGFSINSPMGLCKIPSIPSVIWNGIHIGSPEAWYVAYALMNRKEKADVLLSYLKNVGANAETIQLLLNEPLPDEMLEEISSLNRGDNYK